MPRNIYEYSFKKVVYSGLIEIFFKSSNFFPIILQEQLTTLDFFSYCGGSLGLFLGFSAVSAIEIFYYLSLRIICFRRQSNKIFSSYQNKEPVVTKNYIVEFAENSSIHGCNQIVMKGRHWIERILWVGVVVSAVFFCCTTTHDFLVKYLDASVMMKYEDPIGSFEEIAFPAVTFNHELFMDIEDSNYMYVFAYIKPTYYYLIKTAGEK
jgi:hypothetical protein